MYLEAEQSYEQVLKDLLAKTTKLNISVVGNINSGKSLIENTICDYLGNKVKRLSGNHIERTANSQTDSVVNIFILPLQIEGQSLQGECFDYSSEMFEGVVNKTVELVNLIIWVDTTPEKCFAGLYTEHGFSLAQIRRLGRVYTKWLENVNDVPVLRVNGNLPDAVLKMFSIKFSITAKNLIDNQKNIEKILSGKNLYLKKDKHP